MHIGAECYTQLPGAYSCSGHSLRVWKNAGDVWVTIREGCFPYTFDYALYLDETLQTGSATTSSDMFILGSTTNYGASYSVDIVGTCANGTPFSYSDGLGSSEGGGGSYYCKKVKAILDGEKLYIQIQRLPAFQPGGV